MSYETLEPNGHSTLITRIFTKIKTVIPTMLSQLTGDSTHRTVTDAEKTAWNGKSNFSGSYNDLTNKPTIPSVGDGTVTIQKNGATVDSFSTNQAANKTVNITMNKGDVGLGNVDNTADANKNVNAAKFLDANTDFSISPEQAENSSIFFTWCDAGVRFRTFRVNWADYQNHWSGGWTGIFISSEGSAKVVVMLFDYEGNSVKYKVGLDNYHYSGWHEISNSQAFSISGNTLNINF